MHFSLTDILYAAAIGVVLGSALTLVLSWRMERRVMQR